MNETLKQIAIQAQVEHCISHVRLEKFAELIVKQCVVAVKQVFDDGMPPGLDPEVGLDGSFSIGVFCAQKAVEKVLEQ